MFLNKRQILLTLISLKITQQRSFGLSIDIVLMFVVVFLFNSLCFFFFTPVSIGGISLKSTRQRVFSGLEDSIEYSSLS